MTMFNMVAVANLAEDFPDNRTNHDPTFGTYLQRFPFVRKMLESFRDKGFQDEVIRPILVSKLIKAITSNDRSIKDYTLENGGRAGAAENPVLIEFMDNLQAKNTPAIGLSKK